MWPVQTKEMCGINLGNIVWYAAPRRGMKDNILILKKRISEATTSVTYSFVSLYVFWSKLIGLMDLDWRNIATFIYLTGNTDSYRGTAALSALHSWTN